MYSTEKSSLTIKIEKLQTVSRYMTDIFSIKIFFPNVLQELGLKERHQFEIVRN